MKLRQFHENLRKKWAGSLVRVSNVGLPHAKEYLHQLAKEGAIERVWGWYWVTAPLEDVWDFLSRDRNFKMVVGQSAASLWNGDFVHREVYIVAVKDASYGRALKAFGQRRGWAFEVERYRTFPHYAKIDGLLVESPEETVIDCLRRWAFMDAFAVLRTRSEIDVERILRRAYWKRLPGTTLRLKPVLEYGYERLKGNKQKPLADTYVAREVDEVIEEVAVVG